MITIPFLDLFNAKNKSENISIKVNEPKKLGCPISGKGYYYSICQDGKNVNLIYRIFNNKKKIYQYEETWLSQSKDGLKFDSGKKIFQQMGISHNFFVIDKPINNKIIGIGGVKSSVCRKVNGLHLFETNNIDSWNSKNTNLVLSQPKSLSQNYATHFDSLNNIMYDYHDKIYKIYARYNKSRGNRYVQVSTSKDLKQWSQCKLVKFDYNCSNIYAPAVFQYPNSSMYISFYSQQKGAHKKSTTTSLAFSYDGTYFRNVSKFLVTNNEGPNRALSSIIEKDNKFIIYVHYIDKDKIVSYSLRKDGFGNISTGKSTSEEHVLFNPIILNNNKMNINFKTSKNGYIEILLIDNENKVIERSGKLSGDHIKYDVLWSNYSSNTSVSIKFLMKNADIYSISLPIDYKTLREQFLEEMKKHPIADPKPNKISYRRKTRKKHIRKRGSSKKSQVVPTDVKKYVPPQNISSSYPIIEYNYCVKETDVNDKRKFEIKTDKVIKEIQKIQYSSFNTRRAEKGLDESNSGRKVTCLIKYTDNTTETIPLINNNTSNAMIKNVSFKKSTLSSVIEFEYKPLSKKRPYDKGSIKTMRIGYNFSRIVSVKYSKYNPSCPPAYEEYDKTNCGRVATCTIVLENGTKKDIVLIKNSKDNAVALDITLL